MDKQKIEISFVPYKNGSYDFILKDLLTGEEVTLTGKCDVSEEGLEMLLRTAPMCVWTKYGEIE